MTTAGVEPSGQAGPQAAHALATAGGLPRITVVGLGPGPWDMLSLRAAARLEQAPPGRLVLRTARHPVAQELARRGVSYRTLDQLYEQHPTFEAVYDAMARTLLDMAREGEVVYGVPGHPTVGEASVRRLLALGAAHRVQVELVASAGGAEAAWAELGLDPLEVGLAVADAHEVARWARRPEALPSAAGRLWERSRGYLLLQLDSRLVAQEVKAVLSGAFGDHHRVALVRGAGGPGQVQWLPLWQLDREDRFDPMTCLYVPPGEAPAAGEWLEVLARIMAALRGPDGCPWDRQQTRESLRHYLIEEAYEAVAAIERGDGGGLQEELGDLLLQVLFQAQLGQEEGSFSLADVGRTLRDKLVRRHPHVFGEAHARDAAEVLRNWEAIKQQERAESAAARPAGVQAGSLMDGIPPQLPALSLAEAVQRRAARVGFEWREVSGAARKAVEEARELREAWLRQQPQEVYRELGDLLFALVNVARYLKVDPELALRDATRRFEARFRRMEQLAAGRGVSLGDLPLEAQDELWQVAKGELEA